MAGRNVDWEHSPLIQGAHSDENDENEEKWNLFRVKEDKDESNDSAFFVAAEKILKVACYLVVFLAVLAFSVMSKGTLLFMTSLIGNHTISIPEGAADMLDDKFYKVKLKENQRAAWTWSLFFAMIIPEILTFLRSLKICLFKSWEKPNLLAVLMVFTTEGMYAIGVSLLVFDVLPNMDVVKAAMLTNCVCVVPALLALTSRSWKMKNIKKELFYYLFDVLAIAAQCSGFVSWSDLSLEVKTYDKIILPIALFLVSLSWWENYIDDDYSLSCMGRLSEVKQKLNRCRYVLYVFVTIWKILLMLLCMFLLVQLKSGVALFDGFSSMFKNSPIEFKWIPPVTYDVLPSSIPPESRLEDMQEIANGLVPLYVCLIQIFSSFLCYIFATFACRIQIQCFSFAFPLNLTIPITLSLLISACQARAYNYTFMKVIPFYLFWTCPEAKTFESFFTKSYGWIWMLWILSQTWITSHIWTPKKDRISKIDKLFVNPFYSAALIDQSLALNRRREDELEIAYSELQEDVSRINRASFIINDISEHASDHVTRIYACATMWHENKEEMVQMLKSVFRMDEDQSARKLAQIYLQAVDVDFYEFEAHIFFDDAFLPVERNSEKMVINSYVKLLLEVMNEAERKGYVKTSLRPPRKIVTPYGGRLVWTLPGENKLFVHLKDKSQIRHKKRWSQVMYMYYLLGHRLMELPISTVRKSILAMNTYILALDGDIDFKPLAVQLLVDRMKRDPALGAACGRIHPIGSGPMVYYQKFEYAIGHWFQKATEHMIGCVLCSPGCFSLFRGKALMDDNVMGKYTTTSSSPANYVQYDQGEDRWLCTLLLQRGYRVEYCAASDAYTHCPEGFGEFYIQRRRWAPSTMANILDLLMDYKQTVACNDNISILYISYQVMLMVGTILGPGTIFLMLTGAMVAAFRLSNIDALLANLLPVLFFTIICFFVKNDTQILIAQILSSCYALLMMAVLVGTAVQLVEDGIGAPSAIFLIATTCSFVLAALIHPKEFWCILHGILYFLSVPSMYLLLVLYGFINLNVVSWGTREAPVTSSQPEPKKKDKISQKILDTPFSRLIGSNEDDQEGSISFGVANLFKCLCCTYPKPNDEKHQLMKVEEQLKKVSEQIKNLDQQLTGAPVKLAFRRRSVTSGLRQNESSTLNEDSEEDDEPSDQLETNESAQDIQREQDVTTDPLWIKDSSLNNAIIDGISDKEVNFWNGLIKTYLYPLDSNPAKEKEIATGLKELRNKVVFGFLMANSIFVLIIFLLQVNKDMLFVQWPLGAKYNITYVPASKNIIIDPTFQTIEPVGIVFAFFFALVLFIQFVAMLFHRLQTLTHIMASTELNLCSTNLDLSEDAFIDKNAVQIAREMQKPSSGEEEGMRNAKGRDKLARRPTIHILESRSGKSPVPDNLKSVFEERFLNTDFENEGTPILKGMRKRRETLVALNRRRSSVMPRLSIAYEGNQDWSESTYMHRLREAYSGKVNTAFDESDDDGHTDF